MEIQKQQQFSFFEFQTFVITLIQYPEYSWIGEESISYPLHYILSFNYKNLQKRILNLKEKILTDILSFVDNSLLISQEKSYSLSFSFLLCSYNIMSKILLNTGLIIEHNKTELFHFTRAQYSLNPSINLSSIEDPIIFP